MHPHSRHPLWAATAVLFILAGSTLLAPSGVEAQAERFDRGRMWTFERAPLEWFREGYGMEADGAWLDRARLGALRLPGCSGSFVSPDGLILTNHHCVRDQLPGAAEEGEDLLANGYAAASREEERPLPGFAVEQLVLVADVTDRIRDRVDGATGEKRAERIADERGDIEEEARERLEMQYGSEVELNVQFVEFAAPARTSAYIWRVIDDVRLVMVPEEAIGFFGGDVDNFEYPRWNLDIALLRAWQGEAPLTVANWFEIAEGGVEENAPVFTVGNPGSTSRWSTLAQLERRRDLTDRGILDFAERRIEAIESFRSAWPERASEGDVLNDLFGATNTAKSLEGQLAGLEDGAIRARLEAREAALQTIVAGDSTAAAEFATALDAIADVQERKLSLAREYRAFLGLSADGFAAPTLHRAFLAFQVLNLREQGAPVAYTADLMAALDSVGSLPDDLDEELIAVRLEEFLEAFGEAERWLLSALRGRSPEVAAARIHNESLFADSARTAAAIQIGQVDGNDPALRLVNLYGPTFQNFQGAWSSLTSQEDRAARDIGRLVDRFLGSEVAPDATGTLRISDGRVAGFTAADGTTPAAFTRLGGLFGRAGELGGEPGSAWTLPERWWELRPEVDPTVPLNFVASTDISGGSSGSAVLNAELEVVGVVFDSPFESLPSDYLFDPELHRAVAVDVRAILHTLEVVYGLDWIVGELRGGRIEVVGRD